METATGAPRRAHDAPNIRRAQEYHNGTPNVPLRRPDWLRRLWPGGMLAACVYLGCTPRLPPRTTAVTGSRQRIG